MKPITEFLNELNTELELSYIYQDGMDFDEFIDSVENYIYEQEIIYYFNAIKYLKENDPSLNESLSLASELGYQTESLNSELLATLLYQQNLSEEFAGLQDEIEEYFNEYEEYLETE